MRLPWNEYLTVSDGEHPERVVEEAGEHGLRHAGRQRVVEVGAQPRHVERPELHGAAHPATLQVRLRVGPVLGRNG